MEKRIKEYTAELKKKKDQAEESRLVVKDRQVDLDAKRVELNTVVAETQQEENDLLKKANIISENIDERLLNAFNRIRSNARNGLAVVTVERDACGGCFNKIPPQRQLDIRLRKKVIVCEYCGRIMIDPELAGVTEVKAEVKERPSRRRKAAKEAE